MLQTDIARIIYQSDSLSVSEDNDSRWLHIGDESILSAIALQQPQALLLPATQMMMMSLLFLDKPIEVALLGLGGGDSLRFFRHYYPATGITAVEVDAQMIHIAQQWFSLPQPGDGFTLVIDDAGHYIAHTNRCFDLIMLDIIIDSRMPDSFNESNLFAACERHLSTPGVLAINYVATDAALLKELLRRLQQVFQAPLVILPVADHQNAILFVLAGSSLPYDRDDLFQKADTLQQRYQLPAIAALDQMCHSNPLLCN